jgi:hypothetical protein
MEKERKWENRRKIERKRKEKTFMIIKSQVF